MSLQRHIHAARAFLSPFVGTCISHRVFWKILRRNTENKTTRRLLRNVLSQRNIKTGSIRHLCCPVNTLMVRLAFSNWKCCVLSPNPLMGLGECFEQNCYSSYFDTTVLKNRRSLLCACAGALTATIKMSRLLQRHEATSLKDRDIS